MIHFKILEELTYSMITGKGYCFLIIIYRVRENTRLVTAPTIVSSRILLDEPFTGTDCNNNCTPHTKTWGEVED
jgi:hypothetical protein